MKKLTELSLRGNQISDISGLSNLTSLPALSLDDNRITDISSISRLTNLTCLGLDDNQISDVSATLSLANLQYLRLADNQISDIYSLSELTKLKSLRLLNNPLNTAAYCVYLPLILANNPNIQSLDYDPNPNPFTNDCATNLVDLGVFVSHWLETECSPQNNWCGWSDLNHLDGVDLKDFAESAKYWLVSSE
jgi:hypothetical protein